MGHSGGGGGGGGGEGVLSGSLENSSLSSKYSSHITIKAAL